MQNAPRSLLPSTPSRGRNNRIPPSPVHPHEEPQTRGKHLASLEGGISKTRTRHNLVLTLSLFMKLLL